MERYDVIIVGARCAGATTAMLLAQTGRRVLVIDRSVLGRDTLSTHALMRSAIYQLKEWGLIAELEAANTPRIETTTFSYGEETLSLDITEKHGTDCLFAPRRTVLVPILVRAARRAGAEVRYGLRLAGLSRTADQGRVTGVVCHDLEGKEQRFEADLVIGADGVRSTVASLVGAQTYRSAPEHTACIYSYWSGIELSGYHWMYGEGMGAGVVPTNDGLSCVFASFAPERGQGRLTPDLFMDVVESLGHGLAERVCRAEQVGGFRRVVGLPGHKKRSFGPGWALVGDAGYFKDPLTAHGITDALRDAELLARVIEADQPLERYQLLRDHLSGDFFDLTAQVASLRWDLPELKSIHRKLSKTMQREVELLVDLRSGPAFETLAA